MVIEERLEEQLSIRQHVVTSLANNEHWHTAREALQVPKLCCVDGRTAHPVYGMLGGSGGALLRMLQAFVESVPTENQEQALEKVLAEFAALLESYRKQVLVCTHTDNHAVLKSEPTGCGYLKKYRDESADYDFPGGNRLVPLLVQARTAEDEYEVLQGKHQELGTLIIVSKDGDGRVPMVQPSMGGKQFFVYHPQVEAEIYKTVGQKLLTQLLRLTGLTVHPAEFRQKLADLTEKHVKVTLSKLAPGKPVYEVMVTSPTDALIKETSAA